MRKIFILSCLLFLGLGLIGQGNPDKQRMMRNGKFAQKKRMMGEISGKLVNAKTKKAIEFANIIVYNADSSLKKGGVSGINGEFKITGLRPGKYTLMASAVGYETKKKTGFTITRDKKQLYVKQIAMKPQSVMLDEVEIRASSAAIEYKLDKKVIKPENSLSSVGGNATDILKNAPSIDVDIDGNVSLRGSGDFHVLINGRPTVLSGSEALQQIPSSAVKNIEIITNPSVKFAPDGTSGIINIITKKNMLKGFSGQVNANLRTTGGYTGDLNLSYRTDKFNFFASGNIFKMDATTYDNGFTNQYNQDKNLVNTVFDGRYHNKRMSSSFETGVEYDMNPNNQFTLAFKNKIFYPREKGTNHRVRTIGDTVSPYVNYIDEDLFINSYAASLSWFHRFNNNDKHNIQTVIYYRKNDNDIDNKNTYDEAGHDLLFDDQFVKERDNGDYAELKIDYTQPFGKNTNLEAGIQSKISTTHHEYNSIKGPIASMYKYDFDKDIHSAYASISNSNKIVDVKFGLRAEITDRSMKLLNTGKNYKYYNLDIYPSLHISRKLPLDFQVQASYSKRVNRPRPWRLNPYPIFTDELSASVGNPDLKPEYVNSFELGIQKRFKRNYISFESFYRIADNAFSREYYTGDDGKNYSRPINLDTRETYGVELAANVEPFKWWSLNGSLSAYEYKIEGGLNGVKKSTKDRTWRGRVTSSFKTFKNTFMEVSGSYRGSRVGLQSEVKPSYMVNFAVKQFFLNRKLIAIVSIRDIFDTRNRERISYINGLESRSKRHREAPIVSFGISYRFNNFKKTRTFDGTEGQGSYED